MPLRAVLLDLDETLYEPGDSLICTVDRRITAFIAIHTGIPWERADRLRRELWCEFGTTARGLNRLFDVNERDLNRFAVDSVEPELHVTPDPGLAESLRRIRVPCYLFTNATRRYAERVLVTLGVRDLVRGIFDIEFSLFNPKPSPIFYRRVVEALSLPPAEIALVDDNPRNFAPAMALGMRCICVGPGQAPAGVTRVPTFADVPQALGASW
ncbi:MAG: HAD-IA family hydrolase [Armatimonadetes bacterium]|nr:HAD-IA family hydrolase [Armatimonadota bacterium]